MLTSTISIFLIMTQPTPISSNPATKKFCCSHPQCTNERSYQSQYVWRSWWRFEAQMIFTNFNILFPLIWEHTTKLSMYVTIRVGLAIHVETLSQKCQHKTHSNNSLAHLALLSSNFLNIYMLLIIQHSLPFLLRYI
jgi:hypothetical protein